MKNRRDTPFRLIDFFQPKSYYWHSRRWIYFRQGIPAIAVSLLVLLPVALSPLTRGHSAGRYQVAFNEAVRNENFETARLILQKLETLPTDQLDQEKLRFNGALTSFACGQVDEAVKIMESLAPDDATGYAPAHLWLAQRKLTDNPSIVGASSESIVHHLEAAVQRDPKDVSVHLTLGQYYHQTGNRAKAASHLKAAVATHPELHFVLANLYESLGESSLAVEQYAKASKFLAAKLVENANDEGVRINLAISQCKQGEFPKAVQTLADALKTAPNPKLVNVLSTLYLNESDRLRSGVKPDDPQFANSLILLSKALELAPDNQAAINRIALIAAYEGKTSQQATETLNQLMVSGQMTATAHMILGTTALNQGDTQKAKIHFSQAYRLNSRMPALLNNVAWMLMEEDPPKLESALTVVQQAIEQTPPESPTYAHMIETRGQIYRRLKRWSDALADLELALTQFPDNLELHRSLAAVYRALGDEKLAIEHDKRSQ